MAFALEHLGTWTSEHEFEVEADRTKAYAAATNDPVPEHRDGTYAPPVFAVVPIWDANIEAAETFVTGDIMLQALHGEQDIRYHRPVRPGDVLRSRASVVGVHVKPSGTTVVTKLESRDDSGELVLEQYNVAFFRGVEAERNEGGDAPEHKLADDVKSAEPVAVVEQTMDADQTHRYAAASGDDNPIHVDDEVARSVGLPGIIIHGLCTMAFTSWAAITELADGDTARLRRLAVRFSRPVLPEQTVTTRFWDLGVRDGVRVYGYETTNEDGEAVIKDGVVEIAEA